MMPNMLKKSGLMDPRIPMRPSILTRPDLKIKGQIQKVLQTFKAK